jgi:hypothetical protein
MTNRIRQRTIDFVRLMEPVACRFWGNPTRRAERRLYWGNHSARTVDLGKGTWYDHENKVGGGVLDLIEREAGCGRAGAMQWLVDHHFVEPTCAAGAITAKYNYKDERGRLLYQVVRIEPGPDGRKTFRQRRPDGSDGWIWNLQDCRRVPYRLRQLLAAVRDGQTVFIPEGEKDVLSLVSIGCVATTNAGGAGKWMDEDSEFLRGANCILLPDNDEAGRNHVATVAQQLKGAATSIRVIDLAQHWPAGDAPAKADVTDWLAAGGTKEQLEEIVAATPEYEAPPPDRAAEDAYIDELAGLSELEYQRRRPEAKERLSVKFGPLDKIVQQRRQQLQAEAQNEQILDLYPHWAVEPWHESVDTGTLLDVITEDIERYVATLGRRSIIPALWIMFTWVHDAATHSPLLLVNSAEPNSGKSTLLGFINFLARRPIASVDITGPALYRSIDKWQPTFIVDEADTAFVHNDDLRSVINSGWTRGQGIIRCDPDTHEPRLYSSFTPKAIGMKGKKLPDATLSRAIDLVMKRKLPDEEVEDFSHLDNANLAMGRRMLARWARRCVMPNL